MRAMITHHFETVCPAGDLLEAEVQLDDTKPKTALSILPDRLCACPKCGQSFDIAIDGRAEPETLKLRPRSRDHSETM